jgi:hypothetical protein
MKEARKFQKAVKYFQKLFDPKLPLIFNNFSNQEELIRLAHFSNFFTHCLLEAKEGTRFDQVKSI